MESRDILEVETAGLGDELNEINEAFSPLSVRKHGCGKCH